MLHRNEADGVHRVEDAHTNWYLVEAASQLLVVDTGLPRSWASLLDALRQLGRSPADIQAVVLTHAHFDHMGFARKAQQELNLPVWAHERELSVVAHPWRYDHEHSRLPYFRHPRFVGIFAEMTAMGALWVKGTGSVRTFSSEAQLDLPGQPRVIFTPGHTYGHCALLLPDRGVLLAGDAFVMLDPYTGREGPCIVAGAATADSQMALRSVQSLGEVEASVALTGHGGPWRGTMAAAAERALAAGPA